MQIKRNLYDIVVLKDDVDNVPAGSTGTIVYIGQKGGYMVEFSLPDSENVVLDVNANQVISYTTNDRYYIKILSAINKIDNRNYDLVGKYLALQTDTAYIAVENKQDATIFNIVAVKSACKSFEYQNLMIKLSFDLEPLYPSTHESQR